MMGTFANSETRENLMRAFAGESQARNRYTIAAEQAKKQGFFVLDAVFRMTAEQEKAHAAVFYSLLGESAGQTIHVDGGYPVDIADSAAQLLRYAQHNEFEEYETVYPAFGKRAQEEGFSRAAAAFQNIASIEKLHGERFGYFADLLEKERLFVSDVECEWMCLHCGYVYTGKEAPEVCPVCLHDRGFFVRLHLAPFSAVQ